VKSCIWVVSELYYPEQTSTGYFLTRIAEGLAEHYEVCVLCSQPTYSSRGQTNSPDEFLNNVCIHRCWSTLFNKDIFPLRIVNIATITFSLFMNGLRRFHNGDCVIVVTNPPLLPFAVLIASFLRRAKCCLLVHDVYPEVLVATGIAKLKSWPVWVIGWLTHQLYKRMASIIVLGRDMAALVQKKLNGIEIPIRIIPNWADVDFIRPCKRWKNPLLEKLGFTDRFIVQYSGNIGRTHGIEQLVACAEQLKNNPTVHFLFIGFGGKKYWLTQRVKKLGLSNITIMDYRPRTELPVSLTACDVSIISFIKGMAGVSVPSRLYNIMAAGKPIIAVAEPESELALVVCEEDIGWVVSPGDIGGLRTAILAAKSNPNLLLQMGQRARLAAETKYTLEKVNQGYKGVVALINEKTCNPHEC
jgi:colanic acid biosynthesis glycosyl transferase WcaI